MSLNSSLGTLSCSFIGAIVFCQLIFQVAGMWSWVLGPLAIRLWMLQSWFQSVDSVWRARLDPGAADWKVQGVPELGGMARAWEFLGLVSGCWCVEWVLTRPTGGVHWSQGQWLPASVWGWDQETRGQVTQQCVGLDYTMTLLILLTSLWLLFLHL